MRRRCLTSERGSQRPIAPARKSAACRWASGERVNQQRTGRCKPEFNGMQKAVDYFSPVKIFLHQERQTMFSRRDMLAATAVGGVVTAATMTTANATPVKSDIAFGNPNDPPQGAINAKNPRSITDPGPQNPAIRDQFPSAFSPPPTDVGSMPLSWASFNNAPRRIQNGGWARQVTQDSFAVAETISGVNMRRSSGGIREMHWHLFAEWAYMTYGSCRITVLDELGRPYIADVKEGDLWYFPAGLPHSLQGLGPDGCEFLICFDEGKASEYSTLLVSEWFTHTPPDILGQNFGVPPPRRSRIFR